MKTPVSLWTILFLVLLNACGTTPAKEEPDTQLPLYRFNGLYVAELDFETAKQWDTLDVRKIQGTDSFLVYYNARYIFKSPAEGQSKRSGINRDTFPGIFNRSFRTLMLGPAYSMKHMVPPPIRPMHIDTIHGSATFGGFGYKKVR